MNKYPCTHFSLPVVLYFTRLIGQKSSRHPQITYYTHPFSLMQDAANSNGKHNLPPPPILSSAGAATSIIFVATNTWQPLDCRDKHLIVATKDVFCHDKRRKTSFVTAKVCLPRENFCRDKIMFVATKHLSRQKLYLGQLPCRTKIILVAAPMSNKPQTKRSRCHNPLLWGFCGREAPCLL